MSDEEKIVCPSCGSDRVAATHEQMFMVNTGEHYCHSVKTHDENYKCLCLECDWDGQKSALKQVTGKEVGR